MTKTGRSSGSKGGGPVKRRRERENDDVATGYPDAQGLAADRDTCLEVLGEEIIAEVSRYIAIRLLSAGLSSDQRSHTCRYVLAEMLARAGADEDNLGYLFNLNKPDISDAQLRSEEINLSGGERSSGVRELQFVGDQQVRFDNDDDMFKFGEEVFAIDLYADISFVGGTHVRLGGKFLTDARFNQLREKFKSASKLVRQEVAHSASRYEPIDLAGLTKEAEQRFDQLIKRYP